jgi:superfamily II DNA or RNA helicase
MRIEDGTVPEEMYRYFGLIVYDEVHRIGAPKFSLTASPFYGDRIGLTATVQREDGLDPIYRYHLGEPFYKDIVQDLKPRIYFQQTPAQVDYLGARNDEGITNISLLRSSLGRNLGANTFRYWSIQQALEAGRKVLCLSHSKAQLKLFHAMFPRSGLIVGETDKSERMRILRDTQICFAIAKLGSEGIDDDKLDTLFWLTPFRSKISLQQSMGRIQRHRAGKLTPVMVVFEDWLAPPLRKLCQSVKSSLREWAFDFETIRPDQLPLELPANIQSKYDSALAKIEGEEVEADDD